MSTDSTAWRARHHVGSSRWLVVVLFVVGWLGVNWFDLATWDHGEYPLAALLKWFVLPFLAGALVAWGGRGRRRYALAPVAGVLVILANLAVMAYTFRDMPVQVGPISWNLPLFYCLAGAAMGGLGGLAGAARRPA